MYEILHKEAPLDELNFYLSYAKKEMSILEPLCGSGRFLVPFLEKGFNIKGIDNSSQMLAKLTIKVPHANVVESDIENYESLEQFDYIFISSGSVSLFTDIKVCKNILSKIKTLLKSDGKFVFAVDTIMNRLPNDIEYQESISVKTKDNYKLLLKSKNCYDEVTQTQFSPSLYELYTDNKLIQQEMMDFQTHLYKLGEMGKILEKIGFTKIKVYSSFQKEIAKNNNSEMLLYECSE